MIERQLGTAGAYIELEVRGRRVSRDSAVKHLEYLNGEIQLLERKENAARGPATNRARLHRA